MGSIRKHGQTGLWLFDFRYQGVRCREYTALQESVTNKKKLEKVLKVIEAEIAAGTFDYRRFFPGSRNAAKCDAAPAGAVGGVAVARAAGPASSPAGEGEQPLGDGAGFMAPRPADGARLEQDVAVHAGGLPAVVQHHAVGGGQVQSVSG